MPRPPRATPRTVSSSRDAQLGVYKAFGALRGGPGGTTPLTLPGTVVDAGDPEPATWCSPICCLRPVLAQPGARARLHLTTRSAAGRPRRHGHGEDIANFQSTGRELIRVTLPAQRLHPRLRHREPRRPISSSSPCPTAQRPTTTRPAVRRGVGSTTPACGPGTTPARQRSSRGSARPRRRRRGQRELLPVDRRR